MSPSWRGKYGRAGHEWPRMHCLVTDGWAQKGGVFPVKGKGGQGWGQTEMVGQLESERASLPGSRKPRGRRYRVPELFSPISPIKAAHQALWQGKLCLGQTCREACWAPTTPLMESPRMGAGPPHGCIKHHMKKQWQLCLERSLVSG